MQKYNTHYHPPAPTLDVTIVNPERADRRIVKTAFLDTAADITAIPASAVRPLRLEVARVIATHGINDGAAEHPAYIVTLQVADLTLERIAVIEWSEDEVLLGRDVLNEFEIHLDGKMHQFEIRDP